MANASAEEQQLIQNLVNSINAISEGGSGGIVTPPKDPKPELPEGWNPEKVIDVVTEVVEEEELHAPIPDGFTASKVDGEDTISSGLVIYETEEEVNSSNHPTALTNYNQYVWIPVKEINDMVMCKSKTTDTQCHIIRVADEGSPNGFYLKCETHNSTDLAGKLYDVTKTAGSPGTPYTYEMDPNQTDQAYNPNSGYREPAIVTGSDTGNGTKYDGDSSNFQSHGIDVANAQEFLTKLNNDFNSMVKSVYTYGGFYVGRYEMGEGGSTKKGQTVVCNDSDENNWYGMYKALRQKGDSTNREMIWRMPVRPSYPNHWRRSPNRPFR